MATVADTAPSALLGATLLAGWCALQRMPLPTAPATPAAVHSPWRDRRFCSLLGVFALNGIASAIPATLVLFFVADRLDAAAWAPLFLATYFLAAALALPAWVRLVPRLGLAGGWAAGMAVAIVAFAGAATLDQGDQAAFLAVCAVTGAALGADLVFAPALLTTTLPAAQAGGARFGWWQCVAKLNLAAAAGLALPLLEWGGYSPGLRTPGALTTLTSAYCLLPCGLKVLALLALHRWRTQGA